MSDEKHIDEFFKSALDKPVVGADPQPAWERFEAMANASDVSKSTGSVYKASMLGAVASFLFISLISVFDKPVETMQSEVLAENVAPLSIVRFDNEVASSIEEKVNQAANLVSEKNSSPTSAFEGKSETSLIRFEAKKTAIASSDSRETALATEANNDFNANRAERKTATSLTEMDSRGLTFTDEEMSLLAMDSEDIQIEKALQFGDKNSISLILASNKFDGIIGNANNSSDNAVQSVGLEYQRRISNRMAMSVGIMYSHSNFSGLENNYDSVAYSFGSTTYRTTIKSAYTKSLHMPVAFSYRPSAKHEIGLGAELSYLLDVNSEVNRAILGHESETAVLREYRSGYRQGFNDFHMNAMLSYRYQVSQAIQLGLTGRMAISDKVDLDYFDKKRDLNPFYWQLQLTYNLRKF